MTSCCPPLAQATHRINGHRIVLFTHATRELIAARHLTAPHTRARALAREGNALIARTSARYTFASEGEERGGSAFEMVADAVLFGAALRPFFRRPPRPRPTPLAVADEDKEDEDDDEEDDALDDDDEEEEEEEEEAAGKGSAETEVEEEAAEGEEGDATDAKGEVAEAFDSEEA
jgi:hypothetical protein